MADRIYIAELTPYKECLIYIPDGSTPEASRGNRFIRYGASRIAIVILGREVSFVKLNGIIMQL